MQGEHLAAEIPNAHFVVVDGDDHLPYVGDAAAVVREVERFLIGTAHHADVLGLRGVAAGDPLTLLTAAELRVAECVARGMANPAIADALHLSRHTVESHLKRIYTEARCEPSPARRHRLRWRDAVGWPSSGMCPTPRGSNTHTMSIE